MNPIVGQRTRSTPLNPKTTLLRTLLRDRNLAFRHPPDFRRRASRPVVGHLAKTDIQPGRAGLLFKTGERSEQFVIPQPCDRPPDGRQPDTQPTPVPGITFLLTGYPAVPLDISNLAVRPTAKGAVDHPRHPTTPGPIGHACQSNHLFTSRGCRPVNHLVANQPFPPTKSFAIADRDRQQDTSQLILFMTTLLRSSAEA